MKGFCYILGFLVAGEILVWATGLPVPGNVAGMLLIFLALHSKLVKLSVVKPAADLLVKYLALFFVPYGVGLMVYADLLLVNAQAIAAAAFLSTFLTLWATAWLKQKTS
jgi:holin-like protein